MRIACLVVVLVAMIMAAKPAFATEYECFANDAIQWKHGRLERETAKYPDSNTHLLFDEESQELSMARTHDALLTPIQMKIVQPMSNDCDLIAVSEKPLGKESQGITTLRIRSWDKKARLVFFLYEDSADAIIVGKCHVYSK